MEKTSNNPVSTIYSIVEGAGTLTSLISLNTPVTVNKKKYVEGVRITAKKPTLKVGIIKALRKAGFSVPPAENRVLAFTVYYR